MAGAEGNVTMKRGAIYERPKCGCVSRVWFEPDDDGSNMGWLNVGIDCSKRPKLDEGRSVTPRGKPWTPPGFKIGA